MLTIKAATRRTTMWRRLPSRLFTSTFKVQLYLSFNNDVKTPWKSWSNSPETPAPFLLSRLLIGPSWFLSVGTLPKGIRPQRQEEQSQSFRSSWILGGKSYFKRNFLLITSWILRGKNIFKRKVYLTTSWTQDRWRSCPWKPWHSSSHRQSIFLVSLVNKST